jgi:DNA-directed RNA polymerase subunit RPC12/RpoP
MFYLYRCPNCKTEYHTDIKLKKCRHCRKNNILELIPHEKS